MIITYSYDNRKICFGCEHFKPIVGEWAMGKCICEESKAKNKDRRFATDKKCKHWTRREIDA